MILASYWWSCQVIDDILNLPIIFATRYKTKAIYQWSCELSDDLDNLPMILATMCKAKAIYQWSCDDLANLPMMLATRYKTKADNLKAQWKRTTMLYFGLPTFCSTTGKRFRTFLALMSRREPSKEVGTSSEDRKGTPWFVCFFSPLLPRRHYRVTKPTSPLE